MRDGGPKSIPVGGPPGPTAVTKAAALQDVAVAIKAVLTAPDLATARQLLGVAIGSTVQAWSATLDALSGVATTAFGRGLLAQADAPTARAALGLGSAALLAAGQPGGAATLDGSTGKLASAQIPDSLLGALRYQGGWNAAANSPALPAPSAANKGFYFIVLTAGTTSLTGPSGAIFDWQVGDWAVSDGTYWEKVDSSDQVISVAGLQGAISVTALKAALAVAGADITDATATGRALLAAANAGAALSAIGAVAASAPAGTLKANLLGSTAAVTDQTLSAILDALIGSGRGTVAVRGASTWGALALGTSGQTLQSNGTDLVYAASTPGTGALRYDTTQGLAVADQDRARVNIGAPVPLIASATATLVAADVHRPIVATGTITLTAAAGANNNWASGEIVNNNATSGVVTLAVPSGATLTGLGVSVNALALLPQQRARLVQAGATAYVALWVERSPLLIAATLASAVTQADYLLAQGYASYEVALACQVSSGGAGVGLRFSSDGGATFKAGTSDYATNLLYVSGSTVSSSSGNLLSYLPLLLNQDAQTTNWASARAVLTQGSGTVQPKVDVLASSGVEGGAAATRAPAFAGYRSGALVVNALRLIASAGNIAAGSTLTVRGVPAH